MILRFLLSTYLIFLSSFSYAESNLEGMIKELILEKLPSQITDLELHFDSKSRLFEAESYSEIKNVQLLHFAPSYSTFKVSVTFSEDHNLDLSGKYSAYVDVPVTSRSIVQGGIISDSDVTTTRTLLSKMKGGYIDSLEQVIGMQARRNLSPGILIRNSDVVKPTLIRQNDTVSIIYTQNNIKLRTVGIAMQPGAMGDNIKVKNESTGIIVHGSVIGKNTVEVSE